MTLEEFDRGQHIPALLVVADGTLRTSRRERRRPRVGESSAEIPLLEKGLSRRRDLLLGQQNFQSS
jgi:hypothetical protein